MTILVVNHFGIDTHTKTAKTLVCKLRALASTQHVEYAGMYHEDRNYSQVHIDTTMTESELDDWLYRTKGVEYMGSFVREVK